MKIHADGTVTLDLATLRVLLDAASAGINDACQRCEDNQNDDDERELAARQNDEWIAVVESIQGQLPA